MSDPCAPGTPGAVVSGVLASYLPLPDALAAAQAVLAALDEAEWSATPSPWRQIYGVPSS